MERQLLPDDHLTEAVHHLVEEAVLLAGGHTPDARHLLLAILKTHAPTVQQLLPDINTSLPFRSNTCAVNPPSRPPTIIKLPSANLRKATGVVCQIPSPSPGPVAGSM
jgi:hypothetical protein